MVLNTDMMFHLTIIDDAERHARRGSVEGMYGTTDIEDIAPDAQNVGLWESQDFRSAAMNLLVHAADINSAGRKPEVAGMWAKAIYDEFFRQGDREVSTGLNPTAFFQRDKVVIWKAQVCQRRRPIDRMLNLRRRNDWYSCSFILKSGMQRLRTENENVHLLRTQLGTQEVIVPGAVPKRYPNGLH